MKEKKNSIVVISSKSSKKTNKKPKYIYTVTCLYDIPYYCIEDPAKKKAIRKRIISNNSRCFGWYPSFEEAQETVENNYSDIHEYSYKYAVIEKMADGMRLGFERPEEWWYEWEGSHEDGKYVKINKPKELKGVIGWGIG